MAIMRSFFKKFRFYNPALKGDSTKELRGRLSFVSFGFCLFFALVAARLFYLGNTGNSVLKNRLENVHTEKTFSKTRSDIIDRNGIVLASNIQITDLYADPFLIYHPKEVAQDLSHIFPSLSPEKLEKLFTSEKRYEALRQNITPLEKQAILRIGSPGLNFEYRQSRVLPHGEILAHIIGLTNKDNKGISGVEHAMNSRLQDIRNRPVQLSIDIDLQEILHDELSTTMEKFSSIGAAGVIMDTKTSEILAISSLPTFNPNKRSQRQEITPKSLFNRATKGVYELGSLMKVFTFAMGIDTNSITRQSPCRVDGPLRMAGFLIRDFKRIEGTVSAQTALSQSINTCTVKVAEKVGIAQQKNYLNRLGLLSAPNIELPEVGSPLYPVNWRPINMATISYGHGISISPLAMTNAFAAVVNGGVIRKPTLLKRDPQHLIKGERVFTQKTSKEINTMLRDVVVNGTGKNADVQNLELGGKTGTADKPGRNGYTNLNISSFIGTYPTKDPRYVLLVVFDEPKGLKSTYGYSTGGWVAAPTIKKIASRMSSQLGYGADLLSAAK